MGRREILNLPGDVLERVLQPALNSKLGCLIYSIPLVVGVGLAASSCANSFAKEMPVVTPAPSCLIDARPASVQSVGITVFDVRTCPPSSR